MPGPRRHGFAEHQQAFLDSIADAFKQIRAVSGLGQREAAAIVGSTPSRISELENAKTDICVLTLQRWANAYGYHLEFSFIPYEDYEEVGDDGDGVESDVA